MGIIEPTKKSKKNLLSFILVSSLYTSIGMFFFGFIYISSKSNQDIEHYQKYTKKIISEIERHELLKHQIAQGTIVIEKDNKIEYKKKAEIKCDKNDKANIKNKTCEENKKEKEKEENKSTNEITSTNIFRNDEIIKLDNAIIKNDTYSIVTTFDFTNTEHLFSTPSQLCHLVKYLAPELKESMFTTVKFGDFIIKKNPKAMNDQELVFKDCKNQATKIIVETKFYPKDLTTSPTQTQFTVSNLLPALGISNTSVNSYKK